MYSYIKGTIEEKLRNFVVIENNGIGYKIFMSENSILQIGEIGNKVKVYTHYHVREDEISLYGFIGNDELRMFELLLSVSGIGAKSAIQMLSNITPSEFAFSIINNDITKLTKVPGIGKKSAQRIVLELTDKLKSEQIQSESDDDISKNNVDLNEAISALQILGYNIKEIEKALEKIDYKSMSIEDIIKNGLKLLSRN